MCQNIYIFRNRLYLPTFILEAHWNGKSQSKVQDRHYFQQNKNTEPNDDNVFENFLVLHTSIIYIWSVNMVWQNEHSIHRGNKCNLYKVPKKNIKSTAKHNKFHSTPYFRNNPTKSDTQKHPWKVQITNTYRPKNNCCVFPNNL